MAIWDDVIPDSDKRMFRKARMGGEGSFGERPAVVVVDMSYGFVDSRYPLGNSEMGYPTANAIRSLLDTARLKNLPIFFTTGFSHSDPSHKGRWKSGGNDPAEDGLPDSNEIVEELSPLDSEVVIHKLRPSAFFGTNLVNMLIFHKVDTLIVTGMTTSGCVRATVVDAFSYNYRVVVPIECSGDRAVVSHKVSLFDMQMKYAHVAPLADVLQRLETLP